MKLKSHAWLIVLAGFLLVWELLVSLNILSVSFASSPSRAFVVLVKNFGDFGFLRMALLSYINVTLAIVFALGFALLFGVLSGLKGSWDNLLTPNIMLLGSLPDLALLPMLVYWVGPGSAAAIAMGFICAFFPLYFNIREGVKSIHKELFEATYAMGASKKDVILKLIFLGAWPNMLTGIRISFQYLWEILLAIEVVGRVTGIGNLINTAVEIQRIDLAVASMFLVGIMVLLVDRLIFEYFERRIQEWRGEK